jgi:hypothetical protein
LVRQEILEKYPSASLRVFAIWMPALPTDSRSEWDPGVLDDSRVVSLWDEKRVVGTWLAQSSRVDVESLGPFVWDAFLLFGPKGRWQSAPTGLIATGAPVIGESAKLGAAVRSLVSKS